MGLLTFDAQEHRYYLDGVEIPGVTTILKTAGISDFYGGWTEATYRGLHVHTACEWLDLQDLDWRTVHAPYLGYVRGYEKFLKETGFEHELIEYQGHHEAFRYAGTLDRRGRFPKQQATEARSIIDLKTGIKEDWHSKQTAGYKLLKPEWNDDLRFALYLHENGTYHLEPHKDPNDARVFMAALTITHYKWSLKGAKR